MFDMHFVAWILIICLKRRAGRITSPLGIVKKLMSTEYYGAVFSVA
jgi:hypothetical protein